MSRTTSDFLVASRSVGPRWNAAAISGEYLSAASFLGVAGLIAKYGADALWYPVGFTAGYLGLLLFVAAPLRRSGAYTVPDFAEFRLGLARDCARSTMLVRRRHLRALPGAAVPGRRPDPEHPSRAAGLGRAGGGRAIVIANVVGGGMRSITFVQAFQYWLKLTAIAIPALALLALFLADRPALGGPLPPTVERADHRRDRRPTSWCRSTRPQASPYRARSTAARCATRRSPSPGEHTLGAGTTLTLAAGAATPVVAGAPSTGEEWIGSGGGLGGAHPLYQVLSIIVATFLGTMGLAARAGALLHQPGRAGGPAHRAGGDRRCWRCSTCSRRCWACSRGCTCRSC